MDIIKKYFPDFTKEQFDQLAALNPIYKEWNSKINVISRKDIEFFYRRHVLHSLSVMYFFHFPKGTQILDVGSGGGFPGIPLAIVNPHCHFTLIDSIGKKVNVMNAVCEELGLTNVETYQKRAEEITNQKHHFVVSRAVTAFPKFVSWVKKSISKKNIADYDNGIIYLKGGSFEEELNPYPRTRVYSIGTAFSEPFFETKKIIYLPFREKNTKKKGE